MHFKGLLGVSGKVSRQTARLHPCDRRTGFSCQIQRYITGAFDSTSSFVDAAIGDAACLPECGCRLREAYHSKRNRPYVSWERYCMGTRYGLVNEECRSPSHPPILPSGADHRRHRKILSPAFGAAEMKSLLPVFRNVVRRVCTIPHSLAREIVVYE